LNPEGIMTALGKLLVFLNVALCLVLFTWALTLYTQRVDWAGQGSNNQPKGEVAKLVDKLKPGLFNELNSAESRFQTAADNLDRIDGIRKTNQGFYEAQLKLLNENTGPVQEVVFENGKIALDPKGFPKMAPAKDAGMRDMNWLTFYTTAIDGKEKQIKRVVDNLAELIVKGAKTTDEISGDKGLRFWLAVEKTKKDGIDEEILYLEPMLLNTAVEKALIMRRQKDLQARKGELEKARLATRQ